jgi:hypothetical protein
MSNQNPAAPQPQSPQLNRDLLAQVNAHADRSIDRLFADIDELISDDLGTDIQSSPANQLSHHPQHATEQYLQLQQAQTDPSRSNLAPPQQFAPNRANPMVEFGSPQTAAPQPKKGRRLWMKALLGIGATSIAVGGGLLWLVNERKIELPKNIDTSWLPFQSQSQISPEDAKFAEYMRRSISKIESAYPRSRSVSFAQSTSATNFPNPAAPIAAAPTTPATPIAANPTATVPSTVTPAVKTQISLVKILPNSNRPGAIFEIDRQSQTVNVGQKIGTSNWSLLAVTKGEVTVKRKGGEIRSIYVGQKF